MKVTIAAFIGGIVGSIAIHLLFAPEIFHAAEPCAVVEPAPADPQLWLYRGIEFCETKCGKTIPFDVEVEPQRVRCNCGRPPSLGVRR
jgi:hypothetical protein